MGCRQCRRGSWKVRPATQELPPAVAFHCLRCARAVRRAPGLTWQPGRADECGMLAFSPCMRHACLSVLHLPTLGVLPATPCRRSPKAVRLGCTAGPPARPGAGGLGGGGGGGAHAAGAAAPRSARPAQCLLPAPRRGVARWACRQGPPGLLLHPALLKCKACRSVGTTFVFGLRSAPLVRLAGGAPELAGLP